MTLAEYRKLLEKIRENYRLEDYEQEEFEQQLDKLGYKFVEKRKCFFVIPKGRCSILRPWAAKIWKNKPGVFRVSSMNYLLIKLISIYMEELTRKTYRLIKEHEEEKGIRTYTVVEGDTLRDISIRLFGTKLRWPEIYRLNKDIIKSPDLIYPGQVLRIPSED